jgi:hypothetical protein
VKHSIDERRKNKIKTKAGQWTTIIIYTQTDTRPALSNISKKYDEASKLDVSDATNQGTIIWYKSLPTEVSSRSTTSLTLGTCSNASSVKRVFVN